MICFNVKYKLQKNNINTHSQGACGQFVKTGQVLYNIHKWPSDPIVA